MDVEIIILFTLVYAIILLTLVPPTVHPEPPNGEITVRSGASVNLVCRANGNPSPTCTNTNIIITQLFKL